MRRSSTQFIYMKFHVLITSDKTDRHDNRLHMLQLVTDDRVISKKPLIRNKSITMFANMFRVVLALCSLTAVFSTVAQANGTGKPPHILFIVADDLGWSDVGFHGSKIQTPNIDKLASDGVILNNYYVLPLCSPTRSALMTGMYPIHTGLQHLVLLPTSAYGLPLNFTTLPQKLKEFGYATHIVGKWHLGYNKWEYTPTYRGFDTFYGYYNAQEDHYDHTILDILDFRDNKEPVTNIGGEFATFKYVKRAEKIIQSHNASVPLFLYMAFQNVHEPLQAPKKYTDKYSFIKDRARRTYAGMVDSMDEAIGNITETMKEAGLWEDTLVIFSTDNGGWHDFGGYNWPLRGEKFTLWEGGVRGVSFVHGKMLDRRGVKCEGLIHVTDWFPTLVKIAGGTLEDEATKLDGEDVWNAISKGEPARTEILLNIDLPNEEESLNGMTSYEGIALRSGDMKLIMHVPNSSWFKPPELGGKPEKLLKETDPQPVKIALYNITADPEEREDISSKFVDVVKNLTDRINQLQAGVVPALYGPPDIKAVVKALEEGVWTPWQD